VRVGSPKEDEKHRDGDRILAVAGSILSVGSAASADVSISLVQIGGTYNASVGPNPGDTLVLAIEYSVTNGSNLTGVTLIAPSLFYSLSFATLTGGTETGLATFTDPTPTTYSTTVAMLPVARTTDIKQNTHWDDALIPLGMGWPMAGRRWRDPWALPSPRAPQRRPSSVPCSAPRPSASGVLTA